jgi:hypothetical protein
VPIEGLGVGGAAPAGLLLEQKGLVTPPTADDVGVLGEGKERWKEKFA